MRLVRRVMARTRRQSRWVRRFLFVINRELKNEQRKPHIFLNLKRSSSEFDKCY